MSENIAIIGGTSLLESKLFSGYKKILVRNAYGSVVIYKGKNAIFIQRHEGKTPPHRINYKCYIEALADRGIKKIISLNSVGSLKKKIKAPALLIPHDFISPWNISTYYDKEIKHITPSFSAPLRKFLYELSLKVVGRSARRPLYHEGIYLQAAGPRLETPAEIAMFAHFADVVGMTLGSEITLANEKNISLASLCTVDNYANGVMGGVNYKLIRAGAKENLKQVEKILAGILKRA